MTGAPRPPWSAVNDPRRPRTGVATTIGGILVGFDEQVWSRRPPAQEQVVRTDRATRATAPHGWTIELPPTMGRADTPATLDAAERHAPVERRGAVERHAREWRAAPERRAGAVPSVLARTPNADEDGRGSDKTP